MTETVGKEEEDFIECENEEPNYNTYFKLCSFINPFNWYLLSSCLVTDIGVMLSMEYRVVNEVDLVSALK